MKERVPYGPRRSFLKKAVLSGGIATGLAGCLGDDDNGDDDDGAEPGDDDDADDLADDGDDTDASDVGDDPDYDDVSMTIASALAPGHVNIDAAERFKQKIEDETDGAFSVEISSGGAYGDQAEIAGLVGDGAVDGSSGGNWPYTLYAPEYMFFGTPFVVRDWDHLESIMASDFMDGATNSMVETGNVRPIGGLIFRGDRHTAANQPIETVEDAQGLQLRLPGVDEWLEVFQEVGVTPTAVAWTEVYTAMQTGTVEAVEAGPQSLLSINIHEVADYLNLTYHMPVNGRLYINNTFYQNLSDTYQELIQELATEATDEASAEEREQVQAQLDELEDGGMQIIDSDADGFRDAAFPAVERLFEEEWNGTVELIDDL